MKTLSQSALFYFRSDQPVAYEARESSCSPQSVDRRRLKTPLSHVPPAGKLCSATKVQDRHGIFDKVLLL